MPGEFAAVFVALWVGHQVGDHWAQTGPQVMKKGLPGWVGRLACSRHVLSLTLVKGVALVAVSVATGWRPGLVGLVAGLSIDAVSHWWADRRSTLRWLAAVMGKGRFSRLGDPIAAPCGTGAYALDQSWHGLWMFLAALIIS